MSADFWVPREGWPQWLALDEQSEPVPAEDASASTSNFIQIISVAGLDQYRGWIQNWMPSLPYLNAGKRLIDAALANPVIGFFESEASFVRFRQQLAQSDQAQSDPVLSRTAIAGLLSSYLLSQREAGRPKQSRH